MAWVVIWLRGVARGGCVVLAAFAGWWAKARVLVVCGGRACSWPGVSPSLAYRCSPTAGVRMALPLGSGDVVDVVECGSFGHP